MTLRAFKWHKDMHYGTGLTPQPIQSADSLSTSEEEQQQTTVGTGRLSTTSQQATQEASDQTPQLFDSQPLTTAPLLGTTPLYPSPMTPMIPMTPAMPASEIAELVPQLHNIVCTVNLGGIPQKKWSSHHSQQKSLTCSTWMQSQKRQNKGSPLFRPEGRDGP